MNKPTVKLIAYELTHDPVAARLLEQLHFRYKGALARGKASTPQSYANLMSDTGFTFKMVKRGLRVLRDGVGVTSEQHLFQGKNVCHFVLPDQVMLALGGQDSPFPAGQLPPAPEGQLITGTSSGTSSGTSIRKISEPLPKGSVTHSETIVVKQVSGEIEQDTEAMKMSDVMKAQAGKKHLHKPDSVPALEFLWKQKLSEETGAMVVLKAKEYGQLKLFQKQCPEGAAPQVLEWVLDNWNTFSKGVMSEADLKSTPASPLLGFILQWSAQAVIGWTQSTKIAEPQNPMKQEAPIAIPASKPLQLISPKQDYPDSIEEIMG